MDDGAARVTRGVYADPLDVVWLAAAQRMGMRVSRCGEVFASWDGKGELRLSTAEHFDDDDSLAQMILHEICHALVEWPKGWSEVDWGLSNTDGRDLSREHACHRVQAVLLDEWGLRRVLAPTTDHRPYYETIGPDPLAPSDDPAVARARQVLARLPSTPFDGPLRDALAATAAIARAVRPFAVEPSVWARQSEGATGARSTATS